MPAPGGFTPAHAGGAGPPLVLLHGFMETWHAWELVLPALERHHAVLAPTLRGHAGGPPFPGAPSLDAALDGVEAAMDAAGIGLADIVGCSLGGYLALRLAERGRARSVVALAPAGGWADGDRSRDALLDEQRALFDEVRAAGPGATAIAATAAGRRRATRLLTVRHEHLPPLLVARIILAVLACDAAPAMLDAARATSWPLDAARIGCPVRIVWGTADAVLPWPAAAARYQALLPHADWAVLDDVGHSPALDVPLEAAQLILGWTGG